MLNLIWYIKPKYGHTKEDLIAGICESVVNNYLNNLAKGKKIEEKIVFQGGVSKNIGVVEAFKKRLNSEVYVDENSHLMGALGVAIISKNINKNGSKIDFNFDLQDVEFKTIGKNCTGCANNCEIVSVYKDNVLIDKLGGRCERGNYIKKSV